MKYLVMIAWTLGMFLVLSGINTIFNWHFEFLVGWFTVSTWFAVTNWYRYKRFSINPEWIWSIFFITIGACILASIVLKTFFVLINIHSDLAEGLIIGFFYNVIYNELERKTLNK